VANCKFGRLVLIEKTSLKHKDGTYLHRFLCDCGNYKNTLYRNVKTGNVRSCGCLQTEGNVARLLGKCPTNKRGERERAINWSFLLTKSGAKSKNRDFTLTISDIESLVFSNCYYCNKEPSRYIKHTRDNAQVKVPVNGIDRYDNNKGYTLENSVPCCKECNFLKRAYHGDEFITKITDIYNTVLKKGRWIGRL
jgi:hypothetical protein